MSGKCPICGEENNCKVGLLSCWCNYESFPERIFELIPEEYKNKSCICKKCLDKYKKEGV